MKYSIEIASGLEAILKRDSLKPPRLYQCMWQTALPEKAGPSFSARRAI
jgi:hypothetical protein